MPLSHSQSELQVEIMKPKYDVAIIGGGISGLYCAMKLMQHPLAREGTFNIVVLEKCNRWGGRLDTYNVDIHDDDMPFISTIVKEEKGGMRFTYKDPDTESGPKSNMPRLSRLIKDLDMHDQIDPFYMRPQPKDQPNNNALYFGGNRFTEWYAEQNPSVWNAMFSLDKAEQFKSADEIIKEIYRRLLDHNQYNLQYRFPDKADVILAQTDKDLLQEYENIEYWAFFRNAFTWPVGMQEITLNEFSMPALLVEMGYSHSCLTMIERTLGFRSDFFSDWNSGTSLQKRLTHNLIRNDFYQFKKGWSSLLEKVMNTTKQLQKRSGIEVEFHKNCGVEKIVRTEGTFSFMISYKNESNLEYDTCGCDSDQLPTMVADYVVVALPPKAVKQIVAAWIWLPECIDVLAHNKIMKLCDSVMGVQATMIHLYFKDDWWNKDKNVQMYGPNFTSLPCASVYPLYGIPNCETKNCKGCSACSDDPCPAALTIYCDANNAQFWSSLQRLGHKFQSPLQQQRANLAPASEPVVAEAIRQLKKIFNCTDMPQPILTSYRSWDGDDYGHGVHMWRVGVDDREVEVAQPLGPDCNLYFCNEAWSGLQTWVEGSLQSTDDVLDKILRNLGQ